jgi:Flp pilus assembly protein CpaB
MSYRVRNIVIAVVFAAVAAALVASYTGKVEQRAAERADTVPVLKAARDVPAGTPVAEALADGAFVADDVVEADRVVGAFTSEREVNAALVTRHTIVAGQQITGAMLGESPTVRIPDRLRGTTRAQQIELDDNAVLFGTLQTGDHVDLLGSYEGKDPLDAVSRIIARDVEVLWAAAPTPESTGTTSETELSSVVLALPDAALPKVNFTLAAGDLWLVARPTSGADDGADVVGDFCSVVGDGLKPAQVARFIPQCKGRVP